MSGKKYQDYSQTGLESAARRAEKRILLSYNSEMNSWESLEKVNREITRRSTELRLRYLQQQRLQRMESNGSTVGMDDEIKAGKD